MPQFEVVRDETPDPPPREARPDPAASLLMLALKSLSQRALAAIADLFFVTTVFSAWYLWYLTPEPTEKQIVSLSIYAAFVLAANWLVRRK